MSDVADWRLAAPRRAPPPPTPSRLTRPAEFSSGRVVLYTAGWLVTSFALLVCHELALLQLHQIAFVGLIVGLTLLYMWRPLAGYTVFLQILLYQNWILSLLSNEGMDPAAFQMAQGTSFAAAVAIAVVAACRLRWNGTAEARLAVRLRNRIGVALLAVLVYTAFGAVRSSPASAAIYFRNTTGMLLALLVGLDVGRKWGFRTVATIFVISALPGFLIGGLEALAPRWYYGVTNAVPFMDMKFGAQVGGGRFYSIGNLLLFQTVTLFNITGSESDLASMRIGGPNLHPISYAYVVGATALVAISLRRFELILPALALIFCTGAKGASIVVVISMLLYAVWSFSRSRRLLILVTATLTAAYIGYGLTYGLAHGDYHAIGFFGGLKGFAAEPLGHGIGVGGNLSALSMAGFDWQDWQHLGADFAVESAVGVLLYQMGIGIGFLALVMSLLLHAVPLGAEGRDGRPHAVLTDLMPIALVVVLVNGVFQEEAYSPYALGLFTLLVGVMVSNGRGGARLAEARR